MTVDMLRLVVTGSGRSGTQRAAAILTRAGLTCSHELVYRPTGIHPAQYPAEASWLALRWLPHVDRLHRPRVAVTYREPELVVGSFVGVNFFTDPAHDPFARFMLDAWPEVRAVLEAAGPKAAAEAWYQTAAAIALDLGPDLVYHVARPPVGRLAALAGVPQASMHAAVTAVGHVGARRRHPYRRSELSAGTIAAWEALEEAAR